MFPHFFWVQHECGFEFISVFSSSHYSSLDHLKGIFAKGKSYSCFTSIIVGKVLSTKSYFFDLLQKNFLPLESSIHQPILNFLLFFFYLILISFYWILKTFYLDFLFNTILSNFDVTDKIYSLSSLSKLLLMFSYLSYLHFNFQFQY